jgi:hypothetical protein
MKQKHIFEGIVIWTREMTLLPIKYKRECICPLCRRLIEVGDKIYSIINNYILFPNLLVHKDCIMNWETDFKFLKNDWERAKIEREYYKCWFKEDEI